ncbi:hypothetical protein TcasGA2_TC031352 [Tribolium castaneum]|uniref:Reverse transcriptase domain-containing protein n=1 Tax=Tribolium castaneum TaxID=7070 RepID=A0A139WB05_TRICA|nr:hypothetical protein TcasGA2_TC031352 [Tribolium castaneum]
MGLGKMSQPGQLREPLYIVDKRFFLDCKDLSKRDWKENYFEKVKIKTVNPLGMISEAAPTIVRSRDKKEEGALLKMLHQRCPEYRESVLEGQDPIESKVTPIVRSVVVGQVAGLKETLKNYMFVVAGDKKNKASGSLKEIFEVLEELKEVLKELQIAKKSQLEATLQAEKNTSERYGNGQNSRRCCEWNTKGFSPSAIRHSFVERISAKQNEDCVSMVEAIEGACDGHLPKKVRARNTGKQRVYWWNDDIARARKECISVKRRQMRLRARNRLEEVIEATELYKQKRKIYRTLIRKAKEAKWEELINEIERDQWGLGYQITTRKLRLGSEQITLSPQFRQRIADVLFSKHQIKRWNLIETCDVEGITSNEMQQTTKLKKELEEKGGLSAEQFGFQEGKSTLDAVDRVLTLARWANSGDTKRRRWCVLLTFDVKKAFNSANWQNIMEALRKKGISMYLRKVIGSYLLERSLDLGDGEVMEVTSGVPQGLVLGPTLWNILYDGVLRLEISKEATLVAYADDLALVVIEKDIENLMCTLEMTSKIIGRWMKESVDCRCRSEPDESVAVEEVPTHVEVERQSEGDHEVLEAADKCEAPNHLLDEAICWNGLVTSKMITPMDSSSAPGSKEEGLNQEPGPP